jgi:hypothetical protein
VGTPPTPLDVLLFKDLIVILTNFISKLKLSISTSFFSILLIAGDFNSRTGKKIDNLVVGLFGEEVINDNGDKLIDICEQN